MARRAHVPHLRVGEFTLAPEQSHHVRDVLRLLKGQQIELFDDAGRTASASILACDASQVVVRVESVVKARPASPLVIASAIPKGDRADWMIEKLSELGVARFIPLQTDRSIVHPTGRSKFDRWTRIATESAKQSRRPGVMQIAPLTSLRELLIARSRPILYLDPAPTAPPLSQIVPRDHLTLLIGPEGGWSDAEVGQFQKTDVLPSRLADTILRIETAAIAAAAIIALNRTQVGR